MEEWELVRYRGKNIRVTCVDGQVISGFCGIVTQASDNDPKVASIVIEDEYRIEITLPEIRSIKMM